MNEQMSKLISKALTDAAFKAELLKDPRAAIERSLGVKVPAGMAVKVVEDSSSVVHLVLPATAPGKGELSESHLSSVAGGAGMQTRVYYQCRNTAKDTDPSLPCLY